MLLMELSTENAALWLANNGIPVDRGRFTSLGGGVSNHVILAELTDRRLVIKQSLARLRVAEEWLSERDRVFREAAAMRWLGPRMSGGRVPAVLVEDSENYAIAIEAAPAEALMWKTRLFSDILSPSDAKAAGALLGSMVAVSHGNPEAAELFGDQTVFDQLRIDPYYRTTARRHPAQGNYFRRLIEESASRPFSLTHGDWSPKNLLTDGETMWVIDWEVIHYGDPAFDVGFLLNHLYLKSLVLPRHRSALRDLAATALRAFEENRPPEAHWVTAAAAVHLPALLLARVDGKSPAEYLDDAGRAEASRVALRAMDAGLQHPLEIFEL